MQKKPDKSIWIDREVSWLDFNQRVLALARDKGVPLGEQLKFAAIYGSNLDEFFMVRVGSLYDQSQLKSDKREVKEKVADAVRQLADIMPKTAVLQQHCDKSVSKLYTALE